MTSRYVLCVTTLLAISAVGCSDSDFAGNTGKAGSKPTKPAEDDRNSADTVAGDKDDGKKDDKNDSTVIPDVDELDAECKPKAQPARSCEDLLRSADGLVDNIVAARLRLMPTAMGYFEGAEACIARGMDLLSSENILSKWVRDCVDGFNSWRTSEPNLVSLSYDRDEIERRLGKEQAELCLDVKGDVAQVAEGVPTDPWLPFDIICVGRL